MRPDEGLFSAADVRAQSPQINNWQPVGDLASRLAAKAEFLPIGESLIDYSDEGEP